MSLWNVLRPSREPDPKALSLVTVVLTNWKRPGNLHTIIDQLQTQTAKPVLFLWNNGAPFQHPGIHWQVDSSENKMCWPRWFMASMARTEFVAVMDDDLLFTDAEALGDAMSFLQALPHRTVVGVNGMRLDPSKQYENGTHICCHEHMDQCVDIVKGRFMLLRTADLAHVHLYPSPSRETLMGDDIYVSGILAEGKNEQHIIPKLLSGRWKNLDEPHALWKMTDHFYYREKARQAYFPTRP